MNKYIGKPLGEMIEAIEKPEEFIIKIGSVDGGAFFYCGKLSDFIDELPYRNSSMEEDYETKIKRQEVSIMNSVQSFPSVSDYILQNLNKKKKVKTVGNALDYLNFLEDKFARLQKRIDTLEQMKREEYIPIEDRNISDIYPSVDEYNAYICLIEGNERGDYWSTKEYEDGVDKADTDEDEEE